MAITISGTNGIVGAGFTVDNSGVSVTAGVGTFSSLNAAASGLTGALPALDAANLTSIPAANLVGVCTSGLTKTGGFGKILQAVTGSTSTTVSTSGQTFIDTGLTCNITPTAAGSKILILVDMAFQLSSSTYNAGTSIQLLEGSTVIVTSAGNDIYYYSGNNAHDTQNNKTRYTLNLLRTASYSLGDTLTYKTQFKSLSDASATTSYAQNNSVPSHITLIEVSG